MTAGKDAALGQVVQTREQLRNEARLTLGVTGVPETGKLRSVLAESGCGPYALFALGLLSITDLFAAYAFGVLSPDIARSLGIGFGAMAGVAAVRGVAAAVSPLPMAALVQGRARRASLCVVTAAGWSVLTFSTGLVTSLAGLVLVLVADGLSSGTVQALHSPLLLDSYPPRARVRVMSAYTAMTRAGEVLSPVLVAVMTGVLDLTWRGVFIGLSVVSTVSILTTLGLRDPGYGRFDTQELRRSVHAGTGGFDPSRVQGTGLGFWEICHRLMLIPTVRRVLVGFAVLGALSAPLGVFLAFFLEQRWQLEASERAVFLAYQAAVSVLALVAYGTRGERMFAQAPARILHTTAVSLVVGVAAIGFGGLVPSFPAVVVAFGVAAAAMGIIGPALTIALMSIVPATMRPHAGGLFGVFAAAGNVAGALVLGSVQEEYGSVGSVLSFVALGIAGAAVLGSAGKFLHGDLDRMIDEVIEHEEIARLASSGTSMPMLACRGIDFSYGQMQVLFGVDFTVDDGEMVALLGVNGAGKSTLLNVVSGTCLPSTGSVRLGGEDITYVDAERRVRMGVTHIAGGKAVFGPLSVVDNLRTYGYAVGRRSRVDALIDDCFAAFPRLADRRNSSAAQLSGGEQQMLALSKALILRPRLLVIDELSLGLAPVVVGQLLEMVSRINADGTAVVLVEQSVNIALDLVDHAYFMERGQVRFDGPASDLLGRDDLLRSVFLSGSAALETP